MTSLENEKPVKYLVVDSSVLIRKAPIKDITNTAYAVDGVVSEIKDVNTKASLQVLPYDFKLKQPSSDAMKFVTNFSKKTGDYASLSLVDMQLLALTYQLCKENLDENEFKQLKLEPTKSTSTPVPLVQSKLDKQINIAGFYFPKKEATPQQGDQPLDENSNIVVEEEMKKLDIRNDNGEAKNEEKDVDSSTDNRHSGNDETKESEEGGEEDEGEDENEDNEDENEDDDDDKEGWINPSNLQKVRKQAEMSAEQEHINSGAQFKVACMTSDFSMQNVLIQIGIPVLSVDGLIIKKTRSYVLRCMTCRNITTHMEKQFCPRCGYKRLERVVLMVDSDGNKVYKGRTKPPSIKGLRFSLPTPHGGKHPTYPILSEDQPRAHNFASKKSRVQNNPLDPDYIYQASPFVTKDVQSKASRLGIKSDFNSRFNKR